MASAGSRRGEILVPVRTLIVIAAAVEALGAVPLGATLRIFVQELTKARREDVAATKARLASSAEGD
jgi:hypothetical protein